MFENFKQRNPSFPEAHIHHQNFFKHKGTYDLILEQTFFCSFEPDQMTRVKYATKMASLLAPTGKLEGVLFKESATKENEGRPYGATETEYRRYLKPYFNIQVLETAYNSIQPREGSELFGIFQKKAITKTQKNNPLHGITLKTIVTELVERYGTRILVSIADALEISAGKAVLATLTNEMKNWDGTVERELNTFIAKIGGGF